MAITFVNQQESYYSFPSDPITISVNTGSRTNGLLVVGISGQVADLASLAFSATYNSISMTGSTIRTNATSVAYAKQFVVPIGTGGTHDLVIDQTGGNTIYTMNVVISWYDGGKQTAPFDQDQGNSGATDPSVDITPTEAKELITSVYFSESNSELSVGSGESPINSASDGPNSYGGSYAIQTSAATQTIDFTGTDSQWVMSVISSKAATTESASISPSFSESPSSSGSPSFSGSASASPSAPPLISGSACWGHVTGVLESNVRTFASNWSGTGTIENTNDTERLVLNSTEYMESEVVITSTLTVTLLQNNYNPGDTITLQYRHGATEAACLAASWNTYSAPFDSLGYVQVRVESTL